MKFAAAMTLAPRTLREGGPLPAHQFPVPAKDGFRAG